MVRQRRVSLGGQPRLPRVRRQEFKHVVHGNNAALRCFAGVRA
jgi:hypothetical protein